MSYRTHDPMKTSLAALGLSLLTMSAPALALESRPVVVELFTSQGCSSCPPADAFLGDLAQRPNVIALAWHVDYWNYLGWEDPFALPEATARQRVYGGRLGLPYVYTPQMVVDGQFDERGFDRTGVQSRIDEQLDGPAGRPLVSVRFESGGGNLVAEVAADGPVGRAEVFLILFDRAHRTRVTRGENAGRVLTDHNIVRRLESLGAYDGGTVRFDIDADRIGPEQGAAIIVQSAEQGAVLGAAQL